MLQCCRKARRHLPGGQPFPGTEVHLAQPVINVDGEPALACTGRRRLPGPAQRRRPHSVQTRRARPAGPALRLLPPARRQRHVADPGRAVVGCHTVCPCRTSASRVIRPPRAPCGARPSVQPSRPHRRRWARATRWSVRGGRAPVTVLIPPLGRCRRPERVARGQPDTGIRCPTGHSHTLPRLSRYTEISSTPSMPSRSLIPRSS